MNAESGSPPAELLAVARDWVKRSAAGLSAGERRQFEAWLAADPRHRRAFARANPAGADCDWAWQESAVDEILLGLASRARRRKRRRLAVGVAAMLALGAAGLVRFRPAAAPSPAARANSTLVVVRPQQLALPDGSLVELKDDAVVTSDFTGPTRAVFLRRGTAYFHVAKNPARPFVVTAGGLTVRAVGTAFSVELADKVTVLVTEGRVRVDESSPAARAIATPAAPPLASIGAGNSASLPAMASLAAPAAVRPVAEEIVREQTGWRMPKLEFSRIPLRELVGQMNLYNERKFVLGDEATGDLRISGILRADKIDALMELLENDFGVRAQQQGDRIVLQRTR